MPRQVRIEYEGAVYHVMCRGDRRETIVEDDADREMFGATLGKAVERAGWLLHGYVLMSNHYHLLLETPSANLVRGMTWFQTTYTMRLNARHRRTGHVFGGRYKALPVEGEGAYFGRLLDYIHLNPARAGLVGGADQLPLIAYAWSSLPAYAGASKVPAWLCVERGLAVRGFTATLPDRTRYGLELAGRSAEENDEAEDLRQSMRRGWFIGSAAFREALLEKAEPTLERAKSSGQNYHGEALSDHHVKRAREILREELGAEPSARLSQGRKSDPLKVRLATRIRQETTLPLRWIAQELHMGTPMNVSRLTRGSLYRSNIKRDI